MSDFLPARSPLRGRGWGVSLPGRCSGPFRPISTPGGRCCSLTGLGPRTPVPLSCTRPPCSLSAAAYPRGAQPLPLTLPPGTLRPATPLGPGQSCRTRPLAGPSLKTPGGAALSPASARTHPDAHTHLRRTRRRLLARVPGYRPLPGANPHLIARSPLHACLPVLPHSPVTFRPSARSSLPTLPNADGSRPSTGVANAMPILILPLAFLTSPGTDGRKDLTSEAPPERANKKGAGVGSKINTSEFMMASTEAFTGLKVSKQTKTLWKKVRWLKLILESSVYTSLFTDKCVVNARQYCEIVRIRS